MLRVQGKHLFQKTACFLVGHMVIIEVGIDILIVKHQVRLSLLLRILLFFEHCFVQWLFFNVLPNIVGRNTKLFKNDFEVYSSFAVLVHARRTLELKQEVPCEHVVENAAESPHIHTVVVRQFHQQLRRLKPRCSIVTLVSALLQFFKFNRVVEVSDLNDPVAVLPISIINQNIWRLDISMNNIFVFVQVEKAGGY